MNTSIQPAVFQYIGAQALKRPPSDTDTFKHLWRNKFGASPLVCCILWDQLAEAQQQMPNNNQHQHLLWGLMMLGTYADEMDLTRDAAGDDGGWVDPKTF